MPHAGCLSSLEPTAPFSPMVLHLRVNNLKSICPPPPTFGFTLPDQSLGESIFPQLACQGPPAQLSGALGSLPSALHPHLALPRVISFLLALSTSAASVLPARLLRLLRCFPHKYSLTDPALRSLPYAEALHAASGSHDITA